MNLRYARMTPLAALMTQVALATDIGPPGGEASPYSGSIVASAPKLTDVGFSVRCSGANQ